MGKIKRIIKDWMLIISILTGSGLYLAYHTIPALHGAGPFFAKALDIIQPCLLFCMLFLAFCKIEPKDLKIRPWQLWLLLIQGGAYIAISLFLYKMPDTTARIGLETAMLCMICPTATACAVVTAKLGGDTAGVVTYTILINLLVSLLIPLMIPLTNPVDNLTFFSAFSRILVKVFPLLILPCLTAWLVRHFMPGVHAVLVKYAHVSFYIWAIALTFAIVLSTKIIVRNENSPGQLVTIAAVSLVCCALQFFAGKKIGAKYGYETTAGQSLGQKNTVFAIWVGYSFLNPIVSVAGGFYSIWHNCYNTVQLYRLHKKEIR